MNSNQTSESGGGNLLDSFSSPPSTSNNMPSGGDKYAALADIFGSSTQSTPSPAPASSSSGNAVDWAGNQGAVSWNPGGSNAVSSSSAAGTGGWTGSGFGSNPQVPASTSTGTMFSSGDFSVQIL